MKRRGLWKYLSHFLLSFTAMLFWVISPADAQTFGTWSSNVWSGASYSATAVGGSAGAPAGGSTLTYSSGQLATYSPVPVQGMSTFGLVAAGTVMEIQLSPGLAANMNLLIDNLATGIGGAQYRLVALDAANSPVSLFGVNRIATGISNPLHLDELTLDTTTGNFGLFDVPGGDNLNTSGALFTSFNPTIRTLRIETTTPSPAGDTTLIGIQVSAPEPGTLALLALPLVGLTFLRRR